MRSVLTSAILMMVFSGAALAQTSAPAPKAAPPAEQEKTDSRRVEPKLVNIKLELTITDQKPGTQPAVKTVSMIISDMNMARIRTSGSVLVNGSYRDVILNIDARAELVRDGRVRANITVEYKPKATEATTEQATVPTVNEMLTVLLEDGKSLTLSQSADPVTDRAVKIEAKATILK